MRDPIEIVTDLLGTATVRRGARIQSLWSGYGELFRLWIDGENVPPSLIVKHVAPPEEASMHPRGWGSALGHQRKLRSYEVELAFYRHFSDRVRDRARVARMLHAERAGNAWIFILEDLDAAGFPARPRGLDEPSIDAALTWLAAFHARFVGDSPVGLWPTGAYWHLETRPEEHAAMTDAALRDAAEAIDDRLEAAQWKTLVHGDAKLANFCFSTDLTRVAAVDFQYAGGGVGVKDVAYFLGSVLDDRGLLRTGDRWRDRYFALLREALAERGDEVDADALVAEWCALWPFAWADFERFLDGWAPDHWKRSGYAAKQTSTALARLR